MFRDVLNVKLKEINLNCLRKLEMTEHSELRDTWEDSSWINKPSSPFYSVLLCSPRGLKAFKMGERNKGVRIVDRVLKIYCHFSSFCGD